VNPEDLINPVWQTQIHNIQQKKNITVAAGPELKKLNETTHKQLLEIKEYLKIDVPVKVKKAVKPPRKSVKASVKLSRFDKIRIEENKTMRTTILIDFNGTVHINFNAGC